MRSPTGITSALFATTLGAALVIGSGTLSSAGAELDVHHGTINGITATRIVLATQHDLSIFLLNAGTQISLNGKPATTADLRIGDSARLAVTRELSPPMTVRVEAFRGNKPGNPDPMSGLLRHSADAESR